LGVVALSLLPVLGLFTTSRIFYVRDLSFFFWSRHLWLRHTILSGQAPWWDPYVAAGQSAIADALNQIVMPVTLAIRLLPSDVVSFNLWIALPLPIAALGTFVFLRRLLASDAAAAFGACVFGLSGPVVSMINLPNLAWSVAFMPWVLAARSPAAVAIAFGLQGLSGEPVTWVTTGLIEACWILRLEASGFARKIQLLAGLALGGLLAAAQLVPTAVASVQAHRGALATPDFWSLHPLSLWEAIAPNLFGNYFDAFLASLPWMGALNFGRDPFFYSIYVGPLVLVLACAGAARLRRNAFWVAVAVVFTIAALGGYTPFYPLLRKLVPSLMYFRFPVKYIVFAVFAVAVLAAAGWKDGSNGGTWKVWLPAAAGSLILAITLPLMAMPAWLNGRTYALAVVTHLKDPAAGAEFLARSAPPLALRTGGMLIAAALLTALARRRPYAWGLLAGVVCADLIVNSARLNPTSDLAGVSPPAWFTAASGPQRLYIGGRARGYMNGGDPDGVTTWQIPAEDTAIEGRMELNAELPMAPSGWGVREALSYDLPYLWPAEYEAALKRFERAPPGERDAFLRRAGVRWCVLPSATPRPWPAIADVSDWNMRVFECHPDASRLSFASEISGLDAMFDPRLPDGEPLGEARFVEDGTTRVAIDATVTRQAFLILRDSFNPSWYAEVDGRPAPIVRANTLYRAVALSPGRHVIRFSYRPRAFFVGLILSVTALLLIGFSWFSGFSRFSGFGVLRVRAASSGSSLSNPSNPKNPSDPERVDRGFTLIELMIVLAIIAIVLAIAFTEYRNMQARGNEASALSSMRSIAAAQWQFALTCGNMKYAAALPALGTPVPTTGEPFLSPDLTSAETIEKSGYLIRITGKPLFDAPLACNGVPVSEGYAATADPLKPGTSGVYYYGVNADRVLYLDEEKSYKEDLPQSGAAPHGQEVK
jgi:prepilin-type N-terminal cleavage/methylation domain-containing protein